MNMKKEKVRKMTVAYVADGGLYINITNKCTNRCDFCIRNNGDGAYGSDSLWLLREPTLDEILEAVASFCPEKFPEVVFCGYGEPSCRLDVAREAALEIKKRYPGIKVRINTNGQSDLIYGKDTAPMYKDAFDSVSVSLNAPTAARYDEICHSVYGDIALDAVVSFASNVKAYVPDVKFSVVREFLTEGELRECIKISEKTGVKLRIRDYISE